MQFNLQNTNLKVTEMGENILFINSTEFTTASLLLSIPEPFASLHKLRSSSDGDFVKLGNTFAFKAKDVFQIRIHDTYLIINSAKFTITLYFDGSTLSLIF
jgi:hypothetical protein